MPERDDSDERLAEELYVVHEMESWGETDAGARTQWRLLKTVRPRRWLGWIAYARRVRQIMREQEVDA